MSGMKKDILLAENHINLITIERRKIMKTMLLTSLIEELMRESQNGATLVYLEGTLMTNKQNSIVWSTEPQI
jgi:hypothetical protein